MTNMENLKPYVPFSSEETMTILKHYYQRLAGALEWLPQADLQTACNMIEECFMNHKKFFVIGNWGSHATASHFVADMTKTIYGKHPMEKIKDHPFHVECLSDNVPTLTACSNDLPNGYDEIFAMPLLAKASQWDLLLVITWSGNSWNVVRALEVAKEKNVKTLAFLGFKGGKCKEMADHSVLIESDDYGVIEDMHSTFMHAITDYFKKSIAKRYE